MRNDVIMVPSGGMFPASVYGGATLKWLWMNLYYRTSLESFREALRSFEDNKIKWGDTIFHEKFN